MNEINKEIEEMARDIKYSLGMHFGKTILYPYIAQDLHKQGYRNVKDKVVLSKENYNLIDYNFKSLESICNGKQKLIEYWEEQTKIAEEQLKQARQETAREIYEQLCGHGTTYVKKWIKERYGVEV